MNNYIQKTRNETQIVLIEKEPPSDSEERFATLPLGQQEQIIEKIIRALTEIWHKVKAPKLRPIADEYSLDVNEVRYVAIQLMDIATAHVKGISIKTNLGYEVERFAIEKFKELGLIKSKTEFEYLSKIEKIMDIRIPVGRKQVARRIDDILRSAKAKCKK